MAQMEKLFSPEKFLMSHSVEEAQHGMRLDNFMMQFFEAISREHIKKKIRQGEITIQGRYAPHKSSTKVQYGDVVTMVTFKKHLEDEYWQGEKLALEENPAFAHEDEDLVLLSKPAFMSTHPTGRHLFYCATVYAENKLGHKVYGIHRLDRETSGLLCMAKTLSAATELTNAFENKMVKKAYFLIAVKAQNKAFPFRADENLGRKPEDPERLVTKAFPKDSPWGKSAETDFELLFEDHRYVVALAFPLTGRQHQIRVHAAHHGLPLLGDKIYNGDSKIFGRMKDKVATKEDYARLQIPRQALHAIGLQLPYRGKSQLFIDRIPPDLRRWMEANKIPEVDHLIAQKIKERFRDS
jgi:23S rRNA pseudouridine1911/1915/1917 synthase